MKVIIITEAIVGQTTLSRAKLRFFTFVALEWGILSLMGGTILWKNLVSEEFSGLDLAAWLLIVPEPLLISLAFHFWLNERAQRRQFLKIGTLADKF